jgi:hypothetical protein
MEFLLLLLITGLFYMLAPVIFVKLHGKVTSGKAFALSLLNWLVIHAIFLAIYYAIFPNDTGAASSSAPAFWLFVAWRYMTVKTNNKNINHQNSSSNNKSYLVGNSLDNLERKFGFNFENSQRETFIRGTNEYALFTLKSREINAEGDKFKHLVVAYVLSTGFRYFIVESSLTGASMLCEWLFDNQDKKIGQVNYGSVALKVKNPSFQERIEKSVEETLIDQIHTIIKMDVKTDFTSAKNEAGLTKTVETIE